MKNQANLLIKRCGKNLFLSREEKNYWKGKISQLNSAHLKKLKKILDSFDENLQKGIQKICKRTNPKELREKLKAFKKNALSRVSDQIHVIEIKIAEEKLGDAISDID